MNSEDVIDDTLESWLRMFERHRLPLADPHTVYVYRLNLRRFAEYLLWRAEQDHRVRAFPTPMLADLSDPNVMGCVGWLMRERGLSDATASKFRDNMRTFWEFIARKGGMTNKQGVTLWPTMAPVEVAENPPIALPVAKLLLIWEVAGRQPGEVCGIPESLWLQSMIGTVWSTGARKGEFPKAEWTELDLDAGFWTVPAKHRKGRKRGAVYPLMPGAVMLLRRLQSYGHRRVWPMDFCDGTFYNRLGKIMVACGLPDDRRHKFHIFRKSVATMIELFGGDSVKIMGWRDPTMREVYVDRTIAPKESPRDRLPWIDGLEGPKPAA